MALSVEGQHLPGSSHDGTVIRIKRKRKEDPLNTLVIQQGSPKKKKTEDSCLFRLAGTVADNEVKVTRNIIEEFKNRLTSPNKNKIQEVKTRVRKDVKEKQQLSRYKILAKLRREESWISSKMLLANQIAELLNQLYFNTESNNQSDQAKENLHYNLYDIMADDLVDNNNEVPLNVVPTTEELLCNSVKMIRENLKIYDETRKDPEYVYDIYFAEDNIVVPSEEYLEIVEYGEDLLHEYDEDIGLYEDEDDENNEDNWRNEYPDEDEYNSSDQEYADYRSSSSDENEYHNREYRHRKVDFDPYGEYDVDEYFDTVADYDDD